MVHDAAVKFIHLIPEEEQQNVLDSCWTHDVIEDCRQTYNDVREATNERVAEITYALTNEKGKNRAQRGSSKYYEEMKLVPGAVFVKICDRIANYTYSVSQGSKMAKMYEREMYGFTSKLYDPQYKEMFDFLESITP